MRRLSGHLISLILLSAESINTLGFHEVFILSAQVPQSVFYILGGQKMVQKERKILWSIKFHNGRRGAAKTGTLEGRSAKNDLNEPIAI